MEFLADPTVWISLLTLTALEVVLGVDNLVFIAILANRLPEHQRALARRVGLGIALVTRLILLSMLSWIIGLTAPVFTTFGQEISWRDIILIVGGLFLIMKATHEIHGSLEGEEDEEAGAGGAAGTAFAAVVLQIGIIDIVFSLDSVITAVGMVDDLWVMVAAVILAMIMMVIAATPMANFVNAHPTVKMLALSFLILIGTGLVAEGFEVHIPKGYIYVAMAFSVAVEALNLWAASRRRRKAKPIQLRNKL
jgi:predicted tellurium resistance membrane protein TerC